MSKKQNKDKANSVGTIALNKRARHEARLVARQRMRRKRTNENGRHWGDRLRVLRRLPIPKVASPRGFEPRSLP